MPPRNQHIHKSSSQAEYHSIKGRENSFKRSPNEIDLLPYHGPTPNTMARYGFYYSPVKAHMDRLTCFCCKKNEIEWPCDMLEDDNLNNSYVARHLRNSPTCEVSLILLAKLRHDQLKNYEWENDKLFGNVETSSCLRLRTFQVGKSPFVRSRSAQGFPSPLDFASNGFFYMASGDSSYDDHVECLYCGTSLEGWEKGDIVADEHRQRSPNCYVFHYQTILKEKEKELREKQMKSRKVTPLKQKNSNPNTPVEMKRQGVAIQTDVPITQESLVLPDVPESTNTPTIPEPTDLPDIGMDYFVSHEEGESPPVTPAKTVGLSISKELDDMGLDLLDSNNTSTPEAKTETKKKEESRNIDSVKLQEEVVVSDDFEIIPNDDKIEEIDIPVTTLDDLDSYFTESNSRRPSTFFIRSRSSVLPSSSHRHASRSSHYRTKKGTTTINTKPEPAVSKNAQPTTQNEMNTLNSDPFAQKSQDDDKVKKNSNAIVNLDDNDPQNDIPYSHDAAPHNDFADYGYEPPADYGYEEPPADFNENLDFSPPASPQPAETDIKPPEVLTPSKNDQCRPLKSDSNEQSTEEFAKNNLSVPELDQVEDVEGKKEKDYHSFPKNVSNDIVEPVKASNAQNNVEIPLRETEMETEAMEIDQPETVETSEATESKYDTSPKSGKEIVKGQDNTKDASNDPVAGCLQNDEMREVHAVEAVTEKIDLTKKALPTLSNASDSNPLIQDLNVKQNAKKYIVKPKIFKRKLPDGKVIPSDDLSLLSSKPMKHHSKKRRLNKKTKGKGKSQTLESGEIGGSGNSEGSSDSGKNVADEDIKLKSSNPAVVESASPALLNDRDSDKNSGNEAIELKTNSPIVTQFAVAASDLKDKNKADEATEEENNKDKEEENIQTEEDNVQSSKEPPILYDNGKIAAESHHEHNILPESLQCGSPITRQSTAPNTVEANEKPFEPFITSDVAKGSSSPINNFADDRKSIDIYQDSDDEVLLYNHELEPLQSRLKKRISKVSTNSLKNSMTHLPPPDSKFEVESQTSPLARKGSQQLPSSPGPLDTLKQSMQPSRDDKQSQSDQRLATSEAFLLEKDANEQNNVPEKTPNAKVKLSSLPFSSLAKSQSTPQPTPDVVAAETVITNNDRHVDVDAEVEDMDMDRRHPIAKDISEDESIEKEDIEEDQEDDILSDVEMLDSSANTEVGEWMPIDNGKLDSHVNEMKAASAYLKTVSKSRYRSLREDLDGKLTGFISEMPPEELEMSIKEWILYQAQKASDLLDLEGDRMLKVFEKDSERALQVLENLPTID
ncbi:unnamed protein product [Ambrosiozyma monospora]|uniref:Unnamed protein product n=1 Tax=Ambrosiozyma monospora TaxID=43982 RepID=A0A9W6YRX1_AMBMO|nr:unnamed protein product [Ambrosiozyma monospora]